MCDYCQGDTDGFVKPLEKNCHAFIRKSPIFGWIIDLSAKGWNGRAEINFCPMCGRQLGSRDL